MPTYGLPTVIIKKSGIFDFDAVYKEIFNWLGRHMYDADEKLYKHKPGHASGNEIEIEIEAAKKVTPYYMNKITVSAHLWDVTDIPVIIDGKKKIMTKNRIAIKLIGELETDYDDRFGNSKFMENIRAIFENHIIKKKISNKYQYDLYKDVYELNRDIKEKMDMETIQNV